MIVLDGSTVLEILLQTEAGAPVAERLLTSDSSLHAPHLLDVEVAQVLRRFVAQGEIPEPRARQALAALADFPLERYSHSILLPRIWALRQNLSAYDDHSARAGQRQYPSFPHRAGEVLHAHSYRSVGKPFSCINFHADRHERAQTGCSEFVALR